MPSFFITGCSRGIALAMVEELDPNNFIIASARSPSASPGLQRLASSFPVNRLALVEFDIANPEKMAKGASEAAALLPGVLDYLVNSAGSNLQAEATFDEMDLTLLQQELAYMTVSQIQIVRLFLPLIRKGTERKFVFLTSLLGSIETAIGFPDLSNAYSISKAALNMLVRKYGAALKSEGITCVLLHPGLYIPFVLHHTS